MVKRSPPYRAEREMFNTPGRRLASPCCAAARRRSGRLTSIVDSRPDPPPSAEAADQPERGRVQ
jgi:hypothetical protein